MLILSCTALLTETVVLTHQSLGHSEGPVCHTLDTPTVPSYSRVYMHSDADDFTKTIATYWSRNVN